MTHYMNLVPSAYAKIEAGTKTIELRLNDEKRQKISVGDEIVFTNSVKTNLSLRCRVIALHKFSSFKELYENLPLLKCGYTHNDISTATPDDMDVYYSKQAQEVYGVIGIEIELI